MTLNRRDLLGAGLAAGLAGAAAGKAHGQAKSSGHAHGPVACVGLEEHCLPPELWEVWGAEPWIKRDIREKDGPGFVADMLWRLQDFDLRIEEMDRANMEMAVLSHTIYGPQGQPDRVRAHDMMIRGNDVLAQHVSKRPNRFAGFACLSMHDVDAACREMERTVKSLGFRGVMLNNWQKVGGDASVFEGTPRQRMRDQTSHHSNGEREAILCYDDRRFDAFWDTAQKLGVPVYLHPGMELAPHKKNFEPYPFGTGKFNWAYETGMHALRIIGSGVFDRYPKAQLILGHNGEHIATDLWRLEDKLHGSYRRHKGLPGGSGDNAMPYSAIKVDNPGYKAERTIHSYFRTNVSVTTSGQFYDAGLQHIIKMIGADRVIFSTDYPYDDVVEGGEWIAATPISDEDRRAIARGNAIKLLNLPLKA